MKIIGLRIDVDTYRGTKLGVPVLNRILAEHQILATYYFSVGPDNMGRHLWRLLKPKFLWKMLRTNAAGLYGPEIVFMGTAWPGPQIGKHLKQQIQSAAVAGHEIGFHAYDHYTAQAKIDRMSKEDMRRELQKGVQILTGIVGSVPVSSAVPGWRCNQELLQVKAEFPFSFNSDCRGETMFHPVVDGRRVGPLQIPVTLPTYDEALGRNGVTDANYNEYLKGLLSQERPNVLTIHAEAEGGKCSAMFAAFLKDLIADNWRICPLGELAREFGPQAPEGQIEPRPFPGREGWLACQKSDC